MFPFILVFNNLFIAKSYLSMVERLVFVIENYSHW